MAGQRRSGGERRDGGLSKPRQPGDVDWAGFATAENIDDRLFQGFLGVDSAVWQVIVIDLLVRAGREEIIAFAVPNHGWNTPAWMQRAVERTGYLGVTRVFHAVEHAVDLGDDGPRGPLIVPVTWVSEAVTAAFKNLRLELVHRTVPPDCEIIEVGSIV